MLTSKRFFFIFCIACFSGLHFGCFAQSVSISNDVKAKLIAFGNDKMKVALDYNRKVNICLLEINGHRVIQSDSGIYSMIRTKKTSYSTLALFSDPVVSISGNTIRIAGIRYGNNDLAIRETWMFSLTGDSIILEIKRMLSGKIIAEQVALPAFRFNGLDTWEGAYQDYGGIAWFYLFNKKRDCYGVHSSSSEFWNSKTGTGLTVSVAAPGNKVAMDYSRTPDDRIAYGITLSPQEIIPRFDSATHRRRYVRDTAAVWSPVGIAAGESSERITLSSFDFKEKYGRGNLVGVNEEQVSAVLNTIARIGVIDRAHFGGNSWHTPYGPICLHEQYIAQLGLGINDGKYLKGYQQCLDFYRDNAIKPDGRVWARWAYSNEDAMPGEVTDKGFYEAQWGYLLDSNPDYVSNVAELYDQTGNREWVRSHQASCEKALDWIIKRDSNGNGLVEMITDSHKQKRGSDWIDIIWAAYENAFVNAKLYHALVLWADIERQLGNTAKNTYYLQFAEKLKKSFNSSTTEGGFWDEEKKCYIHWRDKDGTVHGTNMITPVNFMAIAYGICDDSARAKIILDNIEAQMQKEQLFFWPLCLYSYAEGEGNDWQFPFPNYENGDIFLSWGSVAVKAYAAYKPALALKYVKNVLSQYARDGLAFQRYGRAKQDGLGDDILSGNSLAVVGLYQAIYGINPLYNRFYLDPHITEQLAGTRIKYNYRGRQLTIGLDMNKYTISTDGFTLSSAADFGFYDTGEALLYFPGHRDSASLKVTKKPGGRAAIDIQKWGATEMVWSQFAEGQITNSLSYQISDLKPASYYTIMADNKLLKRVRADGHGILSFDYKADNSVVKIIVADK